MRIIIETITNLIKPLANLYGILFTIFYVFGIIGIALYGGQIKRDTPSNLKGISADYYLMNFNDMPSAFGTLFALMIVNNWMEIVSMYV